MADITKGYVPPNTAKNTTWALRVFEEWRTARNFIHDSVSYFGVNIDIYHDFLLNIDISRFSVFLTY